MKRLIVAVSLLFSATVFAQGSSLFAPAQTKTQEIEAFLKITDEQHLKEFRDELAQVQPELRPIICAQLAAFQPIVAQACVLESANMSELEQKACVRLSEVLVISVNECNAQLGGAAQ